MEQYISKAALVAEIKKLIRVNELYLSENTSDTVRFQKTGAYSVLNDLLHFLDTLEVKEFQKKKLYVVTRCEEHSDYVEKVFFSNKKAEEYCKQFEGNEDAYGRDITEIEVDYLLPPLEVKEADLEKEIDEVIHNYKLNNHRHTSICSADIEWIARHFYELGFKIHKEK